MNKEIQLVLVLFCAALLSTEAKEIILDCEFETNFCNWTVDIEKPYVDRIVELCGIDGDIFKCHAVQHVYYSQWRIGPISDTLVSQFDIPTELKERGKNIVYSENMQFHTFYIPNVMLFTSTSILYSAVMPVNHEPSCLVYRYLLHGSVYLTVSYLTDFSDEYTATLMVAHAPPDPFNFTYGSVNLPLVREYQILFRVIHENKLLSIAMLDYVHFYHGICNDSCSLDTFRCKSSECIPTNRMCDGQNDCFDDTDESFCYNKHATLDCNSTSFSKFQSNSDRQSGVDGTTDVYKNATLSMDCFPNPSNDQNCSISSVVFSSACFQQFQNEIIQSFNFSNSSIFEFCFYLNNSVSIFCKGCFSESTDNRSDCLPLPFYDSHEHKLAILSVCQYRNFSTESICSRYSDNTSIILAPCTNLTKTNECVSVLCVRCILSSMNIMNENLLRLFGNETNSLWTENNPATLMSCQDCKQFVSPSANETQGECAQPDITSKKISTIANSSKDCDKCDERRVISDSECPKCINKSLSLGNVCLDCPDEDASAECGQCSVSCHPFCPSGCVCFGRSYICMRQKCHDFFERITLQNVQCERLYLEEFEHKHIFKLEIFDSSITNLTLRFDDNKPIFLHRLLIKNSAFSNIFIDPEFSMLLQSIHVYNSTMSTFSGNDFSRTTVKTQNFNSKFTLRHRRNNASVHLSKAVVLAYPQIFEVHVSDKTFESVDEVFFGRITFYDLVNISYNALHIFTDPLQTRVLDLSHNYLLSYAHAKSFLEILYLNNNRLQSANTIYSGEKKDDMLKVIDLSLNNITFLNEGDLASRRLIYMNLSRNRIRIIQVRAFIKLTSLVTLDLSYNEISFIFVGTFRYLESLEELFLQENPFQVYDGLFDGLISLKILQVNFYTICCAKPRSKYHVTCISPIDEISSCDSLIAVPVLNVAIWYIALVASFGNLSVLIYNIKHLNKKSTGAYYVLTINLSCADFLMGVYLFIIAFTNLHYTGRYGLSDYSWRHSITCTISGIIATISSEVSAFIVFLITLDRFIAVKYPFSNFKLTRKSSLLYLSTAWILSVLLALIPLLPGVNLDNFYAQSGICIYLPLSVVRRSGWEYSMIVFVGVNFLIFLGILIGQISIFLEVVKVGNNVRSTKTKQREASLAGTLFAIVLTDVCCWIPIGSIGMLTFFGIDVEKEIYAWMIVVVLPINSALNPILYTLTSVLRNKDQKQAVEIMQLKTQLAKLKERNGHKGHNSSCIDRDVSSIDRSSQSNTQEVKLSNQESTGS